MRIDALFHKNKIYELRDFVPPDSNPRLLPSETSTQFVASIFKRFQAPEISGACCSSPYVEEQWPYLNVLSRRMPPVCGSKLYWTRILLRGKLLG